MSEKKSPDIKIFVSHRIDQDNILVPNQLYIPVRCGAYYDKRENITMIGDNTGENISEKRLNFNEFTVMYWAWKNVDADYYGLCHYRRFINFSDKEFSGPMHKMGYFDALTPASMKEIGIMDETKIRSIIEDSDIITTKEYDIFQDSTPLETEAKTSFQWWLKNVPCYLNQQEFDILFQLIKDKFPQYYKSALEYKNGHKFRGYNCFVMKKEPFNSLCEFVFGVLFELEKKIDTTNMSETSIRFPGYAGEWLYSIWMHHQEKEKKWKVSSRQLIGFANTSSHIPLQPAFKENNINIIMPINDEEIPDAAVTIQSIIDSSSEKNNYDIILLQNSFDSGDTYGNFLRNGERKQLLSIVQGHSNFSIRFYDPKFELEKLDVNTWNNRKHPESDYYGLLLPWILENYNKAIYLIPGAIVNNDISNIYKTELDGNCIGGTRDLLFISSLNGYIKPTKDFSNFIKKLNNPYNYILTNMLLYDFSKIRNIFSKEDVISFINNNNFNCIPKDGINVFFDKKIKQLPQKYNRIERTSIESLRACGWWDFIPFDLQKEWKNDIPEISFSSEPAPLQSDFQRKFFSIAKRTPFYEYFILSSNNYMLSEINKLKQSLDKIKKVPGIKLIFKLYKKLH